MRRFQMKNNVIDCDTALKSKNSPETDLGVEFPVLKPEIQGMFLLYNPSSSSFLF